jgi:hypothetical protein
MQELFRGEWGNSARSSKKSVTNFFGRLFRLAALELFFVFIRIRYSWKDCSVA